MNKIKRVLDSFMNDNAECLDDFIATKTYKHLKNREDYYKLKQEKKELLKKYPSIRKILEESKVQSFSSEENNALNKVLGINEEMIVLERREAFKLGAKESYIFFEEQEMLNI